jgi:MFS transporter, DHA2 family, glioxin efflux transporter
MYILPLYFQSIRGASPIGSGVHILPLILAMTLTSISGAAFITNMGMPMYIMLTGSTLASIGAGLVYTFGADTPAGQWIGYLIILGLGYGFTLQLGIIVGQASSKAEDIAVTTAAINCNVPAFLTSLTCSHPDIRRCNLCDDRPKHIFE